MYINIIICMVALDVAIENSRKQAAAAREAKEDAAFVTHIRTASVEELTALSRELRALRAYRKESEGEYTKLKQEKEVGCTLFRHATPKLFCP